MAYEAVNEASRQTANLPIATLSGNGARMNKPKVYLAGPISGLTYDDGQQWREHFADALANEVQCYSPLRRKQHLRKHGVLEQSYPGHALSTDRGIMTRDHWDCMTCDLIVANLLFAERVSVGTVMEIGWAHAYRKPLVVIMEARGNPHDHPMVREATGFQVECAEDAVDMVRAILLPTTGRLH